jgi:hypothetical protein
MPIVRVAGQAPHRGASDVAVSNGSDAPTSPHRLEIHGGCYTILR